jgi:hypothetical protein
MVDATIARSRDLVQKTLALTGPDPIDSASPALDNDENMSETSFASDQNAQASKDKE